MCLESTLKFSVIAHISWFVLHNNSIEKAILAVVSPF